MSEPERISSGGSSMPQWMKNKPHDPNKIDFDAHFASPPAHDDSFFLLRYPSTTAANGAAGFVNTKNSSKSTAGSTKTPIQDWSKHTQPCQQFINGIPVGTLSKCPPSIKPKPAGTDDGFKGEGAACGSSIVGVAQRMISGRSTNASGVRATSVEPIQENEMVQFTKSGSTSSNKDMEPPSQPSQAYLNMRRGSKSLPATPLSSPPSSPNSKRKNKFIANRFFTGPFELPSDVSGSRSWLLAGLLGQQRESYIDSEQGSLAASVEHLGPAPEKQPDQVPQPTKQVYRPKPSELREMNFWSPTSM